MALLAIIGSLAGCAGLPAGETGPRRTIPPALLCTEERQENPPAGFDVRNHVLIVDSEGLFDGEPLGDALDGDAGFRPQFERILQAFREWRRRPEIAPLPNKILIYFNGGVRSTSFNLERARRQAPCMMQAGYFPIFLFLPAEVLDGYWEQTATIRGGEQSDGISVTTPFNVLADIGEGILRMPVVIIEQFERLADSQTADIGAGAAIASTRLRVRYAGPPDAVYDSAGETILSIGATPLKVVTSPFAYSIGNAVWTNMLRRAQTAIRRPQEFAATKRDEQLLRRYPKGSGGFSMFFAELQRCIANDGECWDREAAPALAGAEITVIGASLGTIALNDLISLYPDLPYRNIVYMAAACSIRHFLGTVSPLLAARPALRFYNLSLHPKADAGETYGFGTAPTGSLLEWIDSMYADAPSMLDRTLGKWRNVAAAEMAFPEATLDQMTFTVFGFRPADAAVNDPGDPQGHLDFAKTEMHYWLEDFWNLDYGG